MRRIFCVLCTAVLAYALPFAASAATLTLGGPSQGSVGGTVSVPLLLSTASGESANAVSASISYPTDLLSLVSISKAGSIITLWAQEPSVSAGRAQMEGVILNPGWSGSAGTVATLIFQVKAAGNATLAFNDASVLANDGNATPILTSSPVKSLTLGNAAPTAPTPAPAQTNTLPPVHITSSSHPDQAHWYAESHVVLDWTNAQGISAVRIGYDKENTGVGTVVYSPAISHKEIDLQDGAWYFHVQEKQNGVWGSIATYAIHVGEQPTSTIATTTEPVATATSTGTEPSLFGRVKKFGVPALEIVVLILVFGLGWLFGRAGIGMQKKRCIHCKK